MQVLIFLAAIFVAFSCLQGFILTQVLPTMPTAIAWVGLSAFLGLFHTITSVGSGCLPFTDLPVPKSAIAFIPTMLVVTVLVSIPLTAGALVTATQGSTQETLMHAATVAGSIGAVADIIVCTAIAWFLSRLGAGK
jgi:hypothetical protein